MKALTLLQVLLSRCCCLMFVAPAKQVKLHMCGYDTKMFNSPFMGIMFYVTKMCHLVKG